MSIIAETSATQIPSGTWSIDPVWSSLEFEVRKVGLIPIKGRVPGFSGTIEGGDDATGWDGQSSDGRDPFRPLSERMWEADSGLGRQFP